MLCILEQLAEETVEMGPRKIHVLEHLQTMTSLVASYKRNDSYKSEQIKEILKSLGASGGDAIEEHTYPPKQKQKK